MHSIKENEDTTDQNLQNEANAILKGKFIALNWERENISKQQSNFLY